MTPARPRSRRMPRLRVKMAKPGISISVSSSPSCSINSDSNFSSGLSVVVVVVVVVLLLVVFLLGSVVLAVVDCVGFSCGGAGGLGGAMLG